MLQRIARCVRFLALALAAVAMLVHAGRVRRRAAGGAARAVGGRRAREGDRRCARARRITRTRPERRRRGSPRCRGASRTRSPTSASAANCSRPCTTKRCARASIPQLVLGVIYHESGFKKYAVSIAGARGYMQVMPFWVKLIGAPDQNLFNLRTNLRYGAVILRHYLDIENGDYYRALGRYNGSLGMADYPTRGDGRGQPALRVRAARRGDHRSGLDAAVSACTRRVERRYRGRFAPSPTGPAAFRLARRRARELLRRARAGGRMAGAHRGRRRAAQPRTAPSARSSTPSTRYGLRVGRRRSCASRTAPRITSRRSPACAPPASSTRAHARGASMELAPVERERRARLSGHLPPWRRIRARRRTVAQRVRVDDAIVAFVDLLQGPQRQDLARDVGDFIVRRADGLFAYQLAVVVDDALQGVTTIVRGADLLPSTPRQIHLQQALGIATRRSTCTCPSRSTRPARNCRSRPARAPLPDDPVPPLLAAWRFLDQPMPARAAGFGRRIHRARGSRVVARALAAGRRCFRRPRV